MIVVKIKSYNYYNRLILGLIYITVWGYKIGYKTPCTSELFVLAKGVLQNKNFTAHIKLLFLEKIQKKTKAGEMF